MNDLFPQRPIARVKVADLHVHPLLADDPRLAKDDPRYLAMRAAWIEGALIPPIYATATGAIADGRHRYWFAQDMGLTELDRIEIQEDEVLTVILTALAGRNHLTKGQQAYFACGKIKGAFEAAAAKRLRHLRNNSAATRLAAIPTIEELGEQMGVGRNLLFQAKRLHEAFANDTKFDFSDAGGGKKKLTLRQYFEPRILDARDPMSLGDACKGVAGKLSPNSADSGAKSLAARNSRYARVLHTWKEVGKSYTAWPFLKPEERDVAAQEYRKQLAKADTELLDMQASAIKAERRARAKGEQE